MDLLRSIKDLQAEFDEVVNEKFSVFREDVISKKYSELYNDDVFQLLPVKLSEIAKDFSNKLENEFRKKMESLKRAVDFAEQEARTYNWNPQIKADDVPYINSKKLLDNDSRLVSNPLFKTKIIVNQSSVHIPTEIYEEDKDILNTIKWTSNMHNVFTENLENLRYQYFASKYGVLLQYPGMKWRKTQLDMFDVRRRQWYVQGASSPKDVLILIDSSGSMHGMSIKITIKAVQKLIDTLGENDYVAVAQFPGVSDKDCAAPHLLRDDNKAKNECFTTFVQANKRNKYRLFQQIENLETKCMADLEKALEFAIDEFHKFDKKFENGSEGANCNRLVIVFTDSGYDYDREKIKAKINQTDSLKNLRIFIYYVGVDVSPADVLLNRTCDYHGYFGHIKSIGAVSNIIDKYSAFVHSHSIHSENELGNNEFRINLAPVNDDGFHDPNDFPPLGLGLMTSLTMPVYNRSGNGSFLGLLGTDMTVAFINELVPHDKLGPTGYAFAINTNGYIIFHPELKNQLGWMLDPPNVDLVELEFSSDSKIEVRKKIINCAASNGTQSGEDDIESLFKVSDEIHTYNHTRTYSYIGVPLSTFGITIVNTDYNKYYPKFSSEIKLIKLGECSDISCSIIINLPRKGTLNLKFDGDIHLRAENGLMKTCKLTEDNTNEVSNAVTKLYTTLETTTAPRLININTTSSPVSDRIQIITVYNNTYIMPDQISIISKNLQKLLGTLQNKQNDKCPDYESRRAIIDLYVYESLSKVLVKSEYINSLIFSTVTGLSMVYPKSAHNVYEDIFNNSKNSPFFQRTFDMKKIILYTTLNRKSFSDYPRDSREISDIMMFKSLSVNLSETKTIPIGVLGLSWNLSQVVSLLQKYEACNESRLCYILEDGGYIISVNNPKLSYQIGYFFGSVHNEVMESLRNHFVYGRVEDFDYQAICPREKSKTSSSNRLKPFINLFNISKLILKKILCCLENFILFIKLLIHLMMLHLSGGQEATATDNKNVTCIKKYYRYYLNDTNSLQINETCSNCTFSIIAHRMVKSNSIIVSFENTCANNCTKPEESNRYPIRDPERHLCNMSNTPRYRLRPNFKCYGFDPNDNFMTCSSSISRFIKQTQPIMLILISKSLLIINDLYL